MQTDPTIGAYLRRHRQAAGLTQVQLAIRIQWSPSKYSNIENGYNDIGREDFAAVAGALGIEEASWPVAMRLPVRASSTPRSEDDSEGVALRGDA